MAGTDSHTTSHGALNTLAFGIGATEMASVWSLGVELNIEVPATGPSPNPRFPAGFCQEPPGASRGGRKRRGQQRYEPRSASAQEQGVNRPGYGP